MAIEKQAKGRWIFAIDRGGTFTDIVGIAPDGVIHSAKLLSISTAYEDAGIEGIRRLMDAAGGNESGFSAIESIRIGTTVATNALLERKGAPTALVTTSGFEDLLAIGTGARPDLFDLQISRPAPLYAEVAGIEERIDADGTVCVPLDTGAALTALKKIRCSGIEHLAIVLKHSWKNPLHERMVAEIAAKQAGFKKVTVSHEIMPLVNFLKRGQTTMIEAYLSPVLFNYVETVKRLAGNVRIEFMQSSGGLADTAALKAKDTILSGPAGGVIGFSSIARQLGIGLSIGFDMGGTSTDVSRYAGSLDHVFECSIDGVAFHTDMLDVETVAAGGGSILSFDGERLLVGPESAGSYPGPACYGLGGPLTVTDANLLLGRIVPEFMPRTFGKTCDQPPGIQSPKAKFGQLADEVNRSTSTRYSPPELAAGFLRIANEKMCRAMKKISVSRGYDIRRHALVCFGGAAAQHACDIARLLGTEKVVVPALSSVLSAYGIAVAERMERLVRPVMQPLAGELPAALAKKAGRLAAPLLKKFAKTRGAKPLMKVYLDIRPLGTDAWLSIESASSSDGRIRFLDAEKIRLVFEREYLSRFGFRPEGEKLEVVNMRVEITAPGIQDTATIRGNPNVQKKPETSPLFSRPVWTNSGYRDIPVFDRARFSPGTRITGPAMIADDQLTLFVQDGFEALHDRKGNIVLTDMLRKHASAHPCAGHESEPDPVMLEVFNNLFMNVAEQMGHTLSNAAHSVNMKERHDFSCALFDADGNLVSNAPHIPVHLGAMEATVRHVLESNGADMRKGDMFLANDPHRGGSHLPDLTVVAPVFDRDGTLSFFIANRGHHADIGGTSPGSMPPGSCSIDDEGIVIGSFLLLSKGQFREKEIRALLSSGKHPARNIGERLSDLRAQVAANNRGIAELERVTGEYGLSFVKRYMKHIRDNARRAMIRALKKMAGKNGLFAAAFSDNMDDGATIRVSIRIQAGGDGEPEALIDFSGTSPQVPGNSNAPAAVTRAAVLYTLRSLVDEDIPLNAGCLEPVKILIPAGSLLNPSSLAAVAVGNVETSQRIVDVLLGALGKAAASQGTMNNLLFGKPDDSGAQYYETIPGGSGASEGHDGASGVQVHMTNTRITDPEVLEERFGQVTVTRFALRKNSGGNGRWRGGDGVERALLFNAPMRVTIISERRSKAPFGLMGGESGETGRNSLILQDGRRIGLSGRTDRIVRPGETLLIETPGGGGYGKPESREE
ncbi:5-oxoprolinase [Prosthecochloris sp. GSB1]|uniref:hydantoinase B/oxoprolinase family protein n=1 Tax=Prosthecochloris sp. GSB1 TaxID=281093 RepID=UPI000B8D19E5|nr:hydantoinase B/oxoprolinase family protein [Prosthecochloris sp. GSB1]ASQ90512.1 5-oxoprolinase [Prosthecochloris sp. GSB1]